MCRRKDRKGKAGSEERDKVKNGRDLTGEEVEGKK